LAEQKANGVRKKCVAFQDDREIPRRPRPGYPIWNQRREKWARPSGGTPKPVAGIGIGQWVMWPAGTGEAGHAELKNRNSRQAAPAAILVSKNRFYRKAFDMKFRGLRGCKKQFFNLRRP